MIGLALAFLTSNVAAAPAGDEPSPHDIVSLDYDHDRSAWGMTCLGYDNEAADRYFDRLFGRRVRRIDAWAAATYGDTEMKAARKREFPEGFIMVGGCRIGRDGEAIDPTRNFDRELLGVERRVRRTRGN